MRRPPLPEDLYRLRIATDPRLSPDGRWAVVAVQTVAPGYDGYRTAIWLVSTSDAADAPAPRQLTLGARNDAGARFSPDGRTLAFLSDRRPVVEEEPKRGKDAKDREDSKQVHLLPLDGPGEARRLTDLPRGVGDIVWSPDGTRLVVTSTSIGATAEEDAKRRNKASKPGPGEPPDSDYRFIDRLGYMLNGAGFLYDKVSHLWLIDAATGAAERLTDGGPGDTEPAWSPDGTRVAFAANRRRDHDLKFIQDIHVVDVETKAITAVTGGPTAVFGIPTWMPDGRTLAVLGSRLTGGAGSRNDLWLFAADGSDAGPRGGRNLSARHDLMPGSGMNSDVTRGETSRLWPSPDGTTITFTAPRDGAYELWRLTVDDGDVERLTDGHHYLSGWDAVAGPRGRARFAYLRSTPTSPPDLWLQDGAGEPRRLTAFNDEVLADLALVEPVERRSEVDGRTIQGWFIPGSGKSRALVTEIHGGPHTLYGWSLVWEFQILAANGMGVFYCNPRGSEGYGEAFNDANHRDWGPGPMRDVLDGIESLVDDGLADPKRLGVPERVSSCVSSGTRNRRTGRLSERRTVNSDSAWPMVQRRSRSECWMSSGVWTLRAYEMGEISR